MSRSVPLLAIHDVLLIGARGQGGLKCFACEYGKTQLLFLRVGTFGGLRGGLDERLTKIQSLGERDVTILQL